MTNFIVEWNVKEPEEHEVGGRTHEEEERAEPVVSVMFEGEDWVCHKNANAINKHATYPESNIFAVRLVRAFLRQNIECAIENKGCMYQGISKPSHE